MILWRISNHTSLAGDGALRASGRWHTRGSRVVYCAQTPAAALLETLVHFEVEIGDLPVRYRLLKIEAPEDAAVEHVSPDQFPTDWTVQSEVTRAVGDEWLANARSALLLVPSAVVPETFNVLLNPTHPDAARIVVVDVSDHVIDSRLLK
ncbi:MAG: RES family NAD+ phosphorylase [Acidobacteria bacterium]|nr:RES family NAD+ phosphorylase [Acidobacteriota bacterium]